MNVFEQTVSRRILPTWLWQGKQETPVSVATNPQPYGQKSRFDLLHPLKQWLDNTAIKNPKLARLLCKFIPSQCPFEREVKILDRTLFNIPPLCKLNPLYEQVVGLRFRALCYLADECGVDVTIYC
ncbi:Mo-dependent nitrogenase C-terminal domain-containing protein [Microcoleus sp. bin38.metabat.b11b12b14.051]|uniref:Mo-dependent nitrogenase C-terminal domain-containing protein n=1 Tax=Microcoleus sp. bin38.metabat.b11b12b14.051 TaxID=2742709 RepID=UPI0025DA57C7|nr:Mo-dependent nitrogenase C-terminal domain-containing protein [Microcoleus sp. bin38.metabat.b11b12b14.051]